MKDLWLHVLRLTNLTRIIPGIDEEKLSLSDRIIIYISHLLLAGMFVILWVIIVYFVAS